jgi:hypothetical protein
VAPHARSSDRQVPLNDAANREGHARRQSKQPRAAALGRGEGRHCAGGTRLAHRSLNVISGPLARWLCLRKRSPIEPHMQGVTAQNRPAVLKGDKQHGANDASASAITWQPVAEAATEGAAAAAAGAG